MKNPTLLVLVLGFLVACSSTQPSKKEKTALIHYEYGTQALMTQDYTTAISSLLKAVELEPKNAQIHNNLGMAYYFKGEKDMAKKHVERALELDDKNTDALSNLGSLLFEEGSLDEAERIYRRCLKDLTYDKQARIYLNLGLIELRRNNNAKATTYFRSAVKEEPNYCPGHFQLGLLQFKARELKDAFDSFRQANMGTCANDPAPLYWQGVTLVERGEYLNARIKFDELTTRFPTSNFATLAREKLSHITLIERREHAEGPATPARGTTTPRF